VRVLGILEIESFDNTFVDPKLVGHQDVRPLYQGAPPPAGMVSFFVLIPDHCMLTILYPVIFRLRVNGLTKHGNPSRPFIDATFCVSSTITNVMTAIEFMEQHYPGLGSDLEEGACVAWNDYGSGSNHPLDMWKRLDQPMEPVDKNAPEHRMLSRLPLVLGTDHTGCLNLNVDLFSLNIHFEETAKCLVSSLYHSRSDSGLTR
jgi:hypothetical protein